MVNRTVPSGASTEPQVEGNGEPLWVAFAGGRMTCKMSVCSRQGVGTFEIELAGILTPEHAFVRDIITDVTENVAYDVVSMKLDNLAFFDGHVMNECALEHVLMLTTYFAQIGKPVYIHMEESCIKEALAKSFSIKKYDAIHFQ